jgi:hypothetical protein
MKIKHIIIGLFLGAFTLTSCSKKCQECGDCPEGVSIEQSEICEDNYETKDEYNSDIAIIEAFGCDCK